MLNFYKSKNIINFENFLIEIEGKQMMQESMAVYMSLKLFHLKYQDIPSWKNSVEHQKEWLDYLTKLHSDKLAEELSQEVKCGALSKVNIMIFFFQALAVNEFSRHINRMLDYIQKFIDILPVLKGRDSYGSRQLKAA